MGLKERLYSKIFFRTLFRDFGGRTAYTKGNKTFVPYFQYYIGEYQSDYNLYFLSEPLPRIYYNEIFNKLTEYNGYDIIKYVEFHYHIFSDKKEFLQFLRFELSEILKLKLPKSRKLKFQSARDWALEKLTETQKEQERILQNEIEKDMHSILASREHSTPAEMEMQIKKYSAQLATHMDQLVSTTESGIKEITSSFVTGNIQLISRSHERKLIELFILLQELHTGKAEQLFKKCSSTDIAAMLRLHFDAFKDKKLNTLQKKITEYTTHLHDTNNQKANNLNAALQDFFSS